MYEVAEEYDGLMSSLVKKGTVTKSRSTIVMTRRVMLSESSLPTLL